MLAAPSIASVESFWLDSTPWWFSIGSLALSGLAVLFAAISTRNAAVMNAPDLELEFDSEQTDYDSVRVRIVNRGKVDAMDVQLEWGFDPHGRVHPKNSWKTPRIRPGNYHVGELWVPAGDGFYPTFEELSNPEKPWSTGILSYRSRLSLLRRRKKRRVQIPEANSVLIDGRRAAADATALRDAPENRPQPPNISRQ